MKSRRARKVKRVKRTRKVRGGDGEITYKTYFLLADGTMELGYDNPHTSNNVPIGTTLIDLGINEQLQTGYGSNDEVLNPYESLHSQRDKIPDNIIIIKRNV